VPLETAIPKAKQSQLDRMAQLQGNAFDTAFVQTVGIKAHREDVVMFERVSKTSKDADVKAFATKMLPTLREHLATAQGIPAKASARLQDPIASAPRP
ncbi:MAG: rane protein, partial [Rhizobacter sp.]|nr:rane protein [Rhizobacter sp.]